MLNTLRKVHKQKRKRVGRGNARRGTFSGRGVKGQKARAGHKKMRPGFEGGRTPLARLLPKRKGLGQLKQSYSYPVNLDDLSVFTANAKVTLRTLKEKGVVPKSTKNVKILGEGELKQPLHFVLPPQNFSASAREKIQKAGGALPVGNEPELIEETSTEKTSEKKTKLTSKKKKTS